MAPSPRENLESFVRRSIETGRSLQQMSRSELESALREFLNDPPGREQLEDALEEVRARSRRGVDALSEFVRAEVRREVVRELRRQRDEASERFGQGLDSVGALFERFIGGPARGNGTTTGAPEARSSPEPAPAEERPTGATTPAKKATARTAAAKKAASKTAAAKKAATKKVPAKKVPAKKSSAATTVAKKGAAKKVSPPPAPSRD